jgi:ATP-dependent Lon protease
MNTVEEEYEQMIEEDKHDVCESDDERTFMKESYEQLGTIVSAPSSDNGPSTDTNSSNEKPNHKKHRSKKHKVEHKKTRRDKEKDTKKDRLNDKERENDKDGDKKQENPVLEVEEDTVKSQYQELVQLKKELMEKLNTKPKSKILRNAIQECKDSISKLVKKSRTKNTKSYYKLVNEDENEKQNTNELSFFKKKMSHQEQLKIMKDLKEINSINNIEKPYRLALLQSNIPIRFKAIALQKLGVLRSMEPSDSEYYKLKNWVDGFMRVPFGVYRHLTVRLNDGIDSCHSFMENAKNTLDNCAYGLNDAKLQILQMVGQWIANPSAMGTAIAIKGPMGTGKTTLVKDGISKILGREFAFIALGGAGDSSFLEGHSYTYEGSSWGKIMQILMDSKSMNPVIYFDELDKISDTPRGEEIVSILTHLTDTTQNCQFHDKYFSEVDFDLSKCLFIFSYNDESKVNSILKDRMYRIQTKGYDTKEKVIIARKHLLPKIREQVSFTE